MIDMVSIPTLIISPGIITVQPGLGSDIIQMVLHADMMVKFVMLLLFFFSIISWTIIFVKWRLYRRARQESAYFLDMFWEGTEFNEMYNECNELSFSPVASLFRSGYSELKRIRKISGTPSMNRVDTAMYPLMDNVERSLKRTIIDQANRLERALSFLATTGNTAPFIGLFGTVWGIMESFRGIGMKGSASLAVVAPGISEALIATAAGLAAAIPAVIAFNYFSHKAMVLRSEMDSFASDFLSVIERQFLKKQMVQKQE